MIEVGSYDAKTRLPELLRRVEAGEEVIITRHGKPIAKVVQCSGNKLVSDDERRRQVQQAMDAFADIRKQTKPLSPDLTIKDLIEEGRR